MFVILWKFDFLEAKPFVEKLFAVIRDRTYILDSQGNVMGNSQRSGSVKTEKKETDEKKDRKDEDKRKMNILLEKQKEKERPKVNSILMLISFVSF